MTFDRGTVVLLSLDPTTGHEQRGTRPCITVSDPEIVADQRFPLIGHRAGDRHLGQRSLVPDAATRAERTRQHVPTAVLR